MSTMSRLRTLVRKGGFEPPRPCGHWHLKPARLPFRHLRVCERLVCRADPRLGKPATIEGVQAA